MFVGLDIGVLAEQRRQFGIAVAPGEFGIGQVLEVGEGLAMHGGFQILGSLRIERVPGQDRAAGERGCDKATEQKDTEGFHWSGSMFRTLPSGATPQASLRALTTS